MTGSNNMFCIAAFFVLAIMGIFSATHRQLAKEALDCVFRRVTLRPCDTGFDTKVKSKILGSLINRSPKVAKFVSKRFELLAWTFMIVFTLASIFTLRGLYNYWMWGSCNGLNQSGFCVFDPTGESNKTSGISGECNVDPNREAKLTLEGFDSKMFPSKGFDWGNQVVFIGCYNCEFTRKAYPLIDRLLKDMTADLVFAHFPTKVETEYLSAYDWCVYQENDLVFWEYVDRLFEAEPGETANVEYVDGVLVDLRLDVERIKACVDSEQTQQVVEEQMEMIKDTGIYGTPTIFMNGKAVVGPKPYRVYKRLLQESYKLPGVETGIEP